MKNEFTKAMKQKRPTRAGLKKRGFDAQKKLHELNH